MELITRNWKFHQATDAIDQRQSNFTAPFKRAGLVSESLRSLEQLSVNKGEQVLSSCESFDQAIRSASFHTIIEKIAKDESSQSNSISRHAIIQKVEGNIKQQSLLIQCRRIDERSRNEHKWQQRGKKEKENDETTIRQSRRRNSTSKGGRPGGSIRRLIHAALDNANQWRWKEQETDGAAVLTSPKIPFLHWSMGTVSKAPLFLFGLALYFELETTGSQRKEEDKGKTKKSFTQTAWT